MSDTEPLTTYKQLLDSLLAIRDKDAKLLEQSIQVFDQEQDHFDKPVCLKPAYAFGTVKELLHYEDGSISTEIRDLNFKHNPDQLILCVDYSPFDEDGDSVFTLNEDGTMTGDKTGKIKEVWS